MKKTYIVIFVGVILALCATSYIVGTKQKLVVFKPALIESDIKIDNLVMVSDGNDIYITQGLNFINVGDKNINNVKFIVKKDETMILDIVFNMDNMSNYIIDHDQYIRGSSIDKSDILTIEIEYSFDGGDKRSIVNMNVSDYLID